MIIGILFLIDKQMDEITRSEAIKMFEAAPERIEIEEMSIARNNQLRLNVQSLSMSATSTSVKATMPESKRHDEYLIYCMTNPDS